MKNKLIYWIIGILLLLVVLHSLGFIQLPGVFSASAPSGSSFSSLGGGFQ